MIANLRRSMLFVPGSNAAMLSNTYIYGADSLMFDLEDSVAHAEKDTARMLVFNALQAPMYKNIEKVVRVNALDSEFGIKDLNAVVRGGVDIVRLPKTDSAEDVHQMEAVIEQIEKDCGREVGSTMMMAAVESAKGIVNANEIANSSKRIIAIALGAEDYVQNLKTKRDRNGDGIELLFARCTMLHAARAAGIKVYDAVFSDVNNEEGFLREASLIKKLGFDGKSLINPRQIELLHNLYAPTQEEVDFANKVVAAYEEGRRKGLGVISLNGKMIDGPLVDQAMLVLERAKSGIKE